jgi:signal transduction histidine kinase
MKDDAVNADGQAPRSLRPYAFGILAIAAIPFIAVPSLLTRVASSDFLPHKYCYLNTPGLVWTNVATDAVIGISYVAISATLAYLVHVARKEIPFSWMFLSFGLFIVACGGTHIMEVVTVWKPLYWLSADIKIITALASLVTAVTLPFLVPKIQELLTTNRVSGDQQRRLEEANVRLLELELMSVQIAGEAAAGLAFWEWRKSDGEMKWWGDVRGVLGATRPDDLERDEQFLAMVHPEDLSKVEAIRQMTPEAPQCDIEFRAIRPDGQLRWLTGKARLNLITNAVMGVLMDVTMKKQSEVALVRSEKLALTGMLAATVAHEINNPLQAVNNALYMVMHDPAISDGSRSSLEIADAEVKRIAGIVRNVLGFHRDSSVPSKVDIGILLNTAVSLYVPEMKKRNIPFEIKYNGDIHATVQANDLRQVFANLIKNAMDAVPNGGKVRLTAKKCNGNVQVYVTDNGKGIARETRGKLFEPFFTTKGEKGTGLGLWVSRGILARSGGALQFRSVVRPKLTGTTFRITIPTELPKNVPPLNRD